MTMHGLISSPMLRGLCALALLLLVTAPVAGQYKINEIRIDQPGTDVDEYFELVGPPGQGIDLLWYVVIGDGPGDNSGVIEEVIPLSGEFINPSGFFVVAEPTFSLGPADLITDLAFENSDNVTHLLVTNFTGAVGDDLDLDDDCVLDVFPWVSIVDGIALVEEENPAAGTECHYGPPSVGPDGFEVPRHVYRCPDVGGAFVIGAVDPVGGDDTPGLPNACPLPPVSVFGLDHFPLGAAQLDVMGGTLVLSNIGDSGDDGVSVVLGDLNTFQQNFGLPPTAPVGARLRHVVRGDVDEVPDSLVMSFDAEVVAGAQLLLTPDFEPITMGGIYTITVTLTDDDVYTETGMAGPAGSFAVPSQYSMIVGLAPEDPTVQFQLEYHLENPTSIAIAGGRVIGDTIIMRPENVSIDVGVVSGIDLLMTDFSSIEVTDEALGLFAPNYFQHRALGAAVLDGDNDGLVLSNIGASGEDGVSIDTAAVVEDVALTINFEELDYPADSTWTMTAFGEAAGVPGVPLSSLTVAADDTGTELTAMPDFSPLGFTTGTTRVFFQSELVYHMTCVNPVTIPVPTAHGPGVGATAWGAQAFLQFEQAIPITLPGGTFTGDRVVWDTGDATASASFGGFGIAIAGDWDGDGVEIIGEELVAVEPPLPCDAVVQLSCAYQATTGFVELSWENTGAYESITINRAGEDIATLAGGETSYSDEGPIEGVIIYRVVAACGGGFVSDAAACTVVVPGGVEFIRGDSDGNGVFDALVDSLHLLTFGFLGGPPPPCPEAADGNGDGVLAALPDGLYLLTHGFLGGPPPAAPYPDCGADPDPATGLGCGANSCP